MKRALCLLCAGSACIIPDREITIEGGPDNPSAVRILERTPLPQEMREICNAESKYADLTFCPEVRYSLPSGLVRSVDGGPFCMCPSGTDTRAIPAFSIYAEDADLTGDDARDTLYGVFLLDPDPVGVNPNRSAAFDEYWPLGDPGKRIGDTDTEHPDPAGGRTAPGQARDRVPQWQFQIDNSKGFVDLCNGADDIAPGLHNLQFMVTDRPWFAAPFEDGDGEVRQVGVPDTASGASYSVTNYVFECVDALDEEDARSDACECEPP